MVLISLPGCSLKVRTTLSSNRKTVSLLPVYFIGFLNFTAMTALYPVMPPYAASLGGTVAQVGVVVALQLYVAAVTQAPVGLLSDRLGRRNLLVAGIMVYILSYFAYLFTSNLAILMVVRCVNGLGNAAFYPAASALVVDIAPQEKRGEALGMFATGTQLGSMSGPALGGFLLQNYNFNAAFVASGVLSVAGLVMAISMMKSIGGKGAVATAGEISLKWLGKRDPVISIMATIMVMVGVASVISFLPLYAPEIHISVARVGLIIATIYIGSLLTRVQAGKLSDKIGRMPVILGGMALAATGAFLFSVFTDPVPLHLAAFIMGLGVGSALPACTALLADVAPVRVRGFAMGLNAGSFNAGQALGATGLGILAEVSGFARMYLGAAVVIAISALVVFLITRKRVPRTLPTT